MSVRNLTSTAAIETKSDADLLACLLRKPAHAEQALQTAQQLLAVFGDLRTIRNCETAELLQIKGVGLATAQTIQAGLELGRRSITRAEPTQAPISRPEDAIRVLTPRLRGLAQEEFHALYLTTNLHPIAHRTLSRGTAESTLISAQLVFRTALILRAKSVILAHNHPGGNCLPSSTDERATRVLSDAGLLIGVAVLDHLIVGSHSTYSMMEKYQIAHHVLDDLVT